MNGTVRRCVLWPGAQGDADELLIDSIRVGRDMTVEVTDA
jgi:hypothetical protein